MNTTNLIGKKITDIWIWNKMEVGGIDQAEIFIQLDSGHTVQVPWSINSENIEKPIDKSVTSLFADLSDYPTYHVNQDQKSIGEISETFHKRKASIWGKLLELLGLGKKIPKAYKPYKITYQENKLKYLKDQKITDFLVIEDHDSVGFIELENGYIFTEIFMSPHGTGHAGLNYYDSLSDFESSWGEEYIRLSTSNHS